MWHEARRQERKIRGMLVDYRKRAQRRRDFYERIKADPTQFLQVHGRQCKVHLDPVVAAAADSAVMMPWQGNENNLIDRFDVRAHLDYIPPVKKEEEPELTLEDRQVNYERYRIVAQNSYLVISEEKFLKQLHLEEQFGYTESKIKKDPKGTREGTGAAIGFNYEEGTAIVGSQTQDSQEEENSEDDNSDSDLDVDLSINVSKIDPAQAHEMNRAGQQFGMAGNDFYSFLTNDMEEAETFKLAKEEEHEKSLYSGRKSRRERRAHREKRLANRKISPPSYAAKESPASALRDESKSPSRSPSLDDGEKITYITSFGDDEEANSKPTYADKVKYGRPKRPSAGSDRLVLFDEKRSSTVREVTRDKKKHSGSPKRSGSRSRSKNERSKSGSRRDGSHRSVSLSRSTSKRSRSRSLSLRARNRSLSRSRSRSKRARTRSSSGSGKSRSRKARSRSRQKSRARRSSTPSSSPLSSSGGSSGGDDSRSSIRTQPRCGSKPGSRAGSKSKSPEATDVSSKSPVAPKPPIIRYYGRKKSDASSSELSSAEEDEEVDVDGKADIRGSSESNRFGNNSGSASKRPAATLSVIERLRLKRQALINRQFKKDKIAETQKIEREKQAQQIREDELREMALKLRRRQRELRHAYDRNSSSDSESSHDSKKRRERDSRSPKKSSAERESSRDKRRERTRERGTRRRSESRDRNRRRRSRSRSRERSRRSRSRSNRRYDRDRNRSRSPYDKESARKLVDY